MNYQWLYTPVTVHSRSNPYASSKVAPADRAYENATSGIYLILADTALRSVLTEVVVTIYSIADSSIANYDFKMTCLGLIDTEVARWVKLKHLMSETLIGHSDATVVPASYLCKWIQQMRGSGFQLGDSSWSGKSVYLSMFKPMVSVTTAIPHFDSFSPFTLLTGEKIDVKTEFIVQAVPFSVSNAPLFMNHWLEGTVCGTIGTNGKVVVYLSDLKYMENMIGGLVSKRSEELSLGMVVGPLTKLNGEGELLVIVALDYLLPILKPALVRTMPPLMTSDFYLLNLLSQYRFADETNSPIAPDKGYNPVNSVIGVVVVTPQGRYWGSAVVISYKLIITNHHVLYPEGSQKRCTIILVCPYSSEVLELQNIDDLNTYSIGGNSASCEISTPLMGVDMSFISLSTGTRFFQCVETARLSNSLVSFREGDSVESIGYGLYFPYKAANGLREAISEKLNSSQPLVSRGIISKIQSVPLFEGDGNPTPSMMIASASCWNGSSGGGIFHSQTRQLLGIMANNGKVLETGEILPKFCVAVPVDLILAGIEIGGFGTTQDLMVIRNEARGRRDFGRSRKANPRLLKLWRLEKIHEEVLTENGKL
ncbi:hypothetical protein BABINDRAFT_164215 [Babjeviella inositovora NRRL Y-12698]|uniref:Serine protease n=1 Tax=Babjeviella inositovora NRRL Y-12698 TaxID=984486 RepID=A0A1E3QXS9_9ASCO|nr:uncharacterized protein BABINDRAFT_164215 [Babjeviella inositovora NRRL Y-12698]ODQ82421.1 hypothetical protein BABINDRAFT_164215 [Babjeviella inositovora NRRL Y-12698]